MRLILVRHGDPDYERDCLTETGKKQAIAVADRLKNEPISEIYSSPCGRALETAKPAAEARSLEVRILEYMREIRWSSPDEPESLLSRHPWTLSERMVNDNVDITRKDWKEHEYFKNSPTLAAYEEIRKGSDEWLASLGFVREGLYYRCVKSENKTLALYSHGGSSTAILSHILSLPFPYLLNVYHPDFTAICILSFPENVGSLIMPQIEIFNDSKHLRKLSDPTYNF